MIGERRGGPLSEGVGVSSQVTGGDRRKNAGHRRGSCLCEGVANTV